MLFSLVIALLVVLLTACANGGTTTTAPNETTTVSDTNSGAGITTTTLAPTSTIAPDAAPPQLRGVWTTQLNSTDTMRLTLQRNSYNANIEGSPETGTGRISVEGDTIEFHGSDRCLEDPGGTYTWVIDNGMLTFALVGDDPCGRVGFLDGFSYTLLSALP